MSPWRILLAGVAGGAATNVAMLVTFRGSEQTAKAAIAHEAIALPRPEPPN